jgi:hypothetical protein
MNKLKNLRTTGGVCPPKCVESSMSGGRLERECVGWYHSARVFICSRVSWLAVTATWDRTAVADFTVLSGHLIARNEKDHEKLQ